MIDANAMNMHSLPLPRTVDGVACKTVWVNGTGWVPIPENELGQWLAQNIKGKWEIIFLAPSFQIQAIVFDDDTDAALYKLKWDRKLLKSEWF
jgi:hypothetical protein